MNKKKPSPKFRPREEWIEQPQEHLGDYLAPVVKEAAARGIEVWLDKRARGQKLKPDTNKYKSGGRLLSGILRSKQGDSPMRGYSGPYPEKEYYQSAEHENKPVSKTIMKKIIPGQSMHIAVLACLKDALVRRVDLASSMSKALKVAMKEQSNDDTVDVARELKALTTQHIRLTRKLTGEEQSDKEVIAELDRLDARILHLREKTKAKPKLDVNLKPDVSAASLAKEFVELGGGIDAMDIATKKALLKCLISRMAVDLETREVEMDLSLPGDLHALFASNDKSTLLAHLCSQSSHKSARVFGPKLGFYRLNYLWDKHEYVWNRLKEAS